MNLLERKNLAIESITAERDALALKLYNAEKHLEALTENIDECNADDDENDAITRAVNTLLRPAANATASLVITWLLGRCDPLTLADTLAALPQVRRESILLALGRDLGPLAIDAFETGARWAWREPDEEWPLTAALVWWNGRRA